MVDQALTRVNVGTGSGFVRSKVWTFGAVTGWTAAGSSGSPASSTASNHRSTRPEAPIPGPGALRRHDRPGAGVMDGMSIYLRVEVKANDGQQAEFERTAKALVAGTADEA